MATRIARRDEEKQRYWGDVMRRFQQSGLSARAFCAQEEIREHQFYAWRKELRQRGSAVESPNVRPAFVPIEVKKTAVIRSDEACIELRTPAGYTFKVPSGVAQELCQLVLKMLVEKPC
jgi:transposase-like protein